MADKDFIKEKIVGRNAGWKKSFRHYLRVMVSALLFGAVGAASFAFLEPVIGDKLHTTEPETVVLTTEEIPTETEPETTEPEPTVPETESVPETAAVDREMINEYVDDAMKRHPVTIDDFNKLNNVLKGVITDAEQAVVEVKTGDTAGTDLFGQPVRSEKSYSGMILAKTSTELLILTSSEAAGSDQLSVIFQRENAYPATLEAVDSRDGIAVISVQHTNMTKQDLGSVKCITIGNSSILQRGDIVLSVGAPAGEIYSVAEGSVSSVSFNQHTDDSTMEKVLLHIDAEPSQCAFLLNTSGELVGWASEKIDEAPTGYLYMAAVSDYVDRLEALSNGQPYPYLGIDCQEVNAEMKSHGLPDGLFIHECVEGSPSYNAGMQSGDIITELADTEVRTMADYRSVLKKLKAGQEIKAVVERQRGTEYVEVSFNLTVKER